MAECKALPESAVKGLRVDSLNAADNFTCMNIMLIKLEKVALDNAFLLKATHGNEMAKHCLCIGSES